MSGLPGEMGGVPDSLMTKYKAYSTLENVSRKMSPILILAGQNDTQIPPDINSKAFHEKAAGIGVKSKLHQFEDEGHLILKSENLDFMEKQVLSFIENVLNKK